MPIKIAMLLLFFSTMIIIGIKCRKHSTDVAGFVLGGRSVGPWLTAFAYGTSYFSAVIFVGYAGQFGWRFGIASTWIGIGNAILGSLLAWAVLGRRTRIMTQSLGSTTMPDFFGIRFDSKSLKIGASTIAFIFLIPYTASLYNGLSRLFAMAFNIDYIVCIVIMSILTGIYVVVGGYMATAVNDFVQGIIMFFGIITVVIAVIVSCGGFTEAMQALSQISDASSGVEAGELVSLFGPDPFNLFCVILLTSLGTWGLPQMVGKFYAIKDEKAVAKGTVVSTVFAFIVAGGCYFLGGFGRLFSDKVNISVDGYDAIIPAMLEGLPEIIIALTVILVLSASMSTLSSLVLTSSSTITIDLIKGNIIKKMSQKQQVGIMRIFIVVFIAISAIIAIVQYKYNITFIAQLMGLSWGALSGSFLAPFLYGLFWKRTTKVSVWVCFVLGSGIMLLNMIAPGIFPTWLQSPINCGACAMLLGLIVVPVVSLLTPAPDKDNVEKMFFCFKK